MYKGAAVPPTNLRDSENVHMPVASARCEEFPLWIDSAALEGDIGLILETNDSLALTVKDLCIITIFRDGDDLMADPLHSLYS